VRVGFANVRKDQESGPNQRTKVLCPEGNQKGRHKFVHPKHKNKIYNFYIKTEISKVRSQVDPVPQEMCHLRGFLGEQTPMRLTKEMCQVQL